MTDHQQLYNDQSDSDCDHQQLYNDQSDSDLWPPTIVQWPVW